jgi:hypothetical protein
MYTCNVYSRKQTHCRAGHAADHTWFIKNKQMLFNHTHESNMNKSKVHKRHTPASIPKNHKHENNL